MDVDAMGKIAASEGLGALWQGTAASLVLVSNPIIQFVSYEWLKKRADAIARSGGRALPSSLQAFVLGAAAKAVATLATYPLQLAQSALRVNKTGPDGQPLPPEYSNTLDCLAKEYRRAGLAGLYRGLSAKMWQTVLTAALLFLCYEEITAAMLKALHGLRRGGANGPSIKTA